MGDYQPLDYVCDDGDLTIDGVPMRCPAWAVLDLTDLWLPASVRGNNRIVPGAAGVIANPKRKTITRRSLVLAITGGFDLDGNENANPWVGLRDNIAYLVANVIDPPALPAVTRSAVLSLPDASTATADVQVFDLQLVHKVDAVGTWTFELEIPAGEFV
jgi:hypothetical protein